MPFFILQPLVENALHHGISSHAGAGSIEIAARRTGDQLRLSVSDDGPGIDTQDEQRGIGLANTSAASRAVWRRAVARFSGFSGGRFRVDVTIPYRERVAESSGASAS